MKRYLLDTHALIWLFEDKTSLPKWLKEAYVNKPEILAYSIVSLWEIAIKYSSQKLNLGVSLQSFVEMTNLAYGQHLGINETHLFTLQTLPHHHKDPFDRLLIAQAIAEGMTLVTEDRHIPTYPAAVRWE